MADKIQVQHEWGHDQLADDLAASLAAPRRMIWTNLQLGPSGSPRPDVYSLEKSFVRPNPTAYEVKISRGDFRADVTAGKWQAYLKYSHRVIFAAPADLLTKLDVPEMCGLVLRHDKAWRLAKAATVNPRAIAQEALLKLLIDGVEREGPKQRERFWHNSDHTREFTKKFGSEAGRYVADAATVKQNIRHCQEQQESMLAAAKREAETIRQRATDSLPLEWKALLHVLGLPDGSDEWAVRRAIADLQRTKGGGEEGAALRQIIPTLRRLVQQNEALIQEGGGL